MECWTTPDWNDNDWTNIDLPSTSIRKIEGYSSAVGNSSVYYRLHINVPESIVNIKSELSFSPSSVVHKEFVIYLNGRLVHSGNGDTYAGSIANISIPKSDIKDGKIQITVKGSLSPADEGIFSRKPAYLGAKSSLDLLYVSEERAMGSYYLLFLLSKGGIFVIFSLLFFFTKGQTGFFAFLFYAFCVTFENFLIGDFLTERLSLNVRAVIFFLIKCFGISALLLFLLAQHQVQKRQKRILFIGGLVSLGVLLASLDYGWGTKTVTIKMLHQATNLYLVLSLATAIVIGLIDMRRWKRMGIKDSQTAARRNMMIFVSLYLLGLIWEFYFNAWKGFDKRAVLDLFFFLYVAFRSARDFGNTEGKITTLEQHMVEKQRMEAELREAAEIARVFLPDSKPDWKGIDISVFHRSLTETSGDWYAFEESRSGDLYHFILCDVTGHGAQAAIIVSTCKTVLSSIKHAKSELLEDKDFLSHYLRDLNSILFDQGHGYHVTTLLGMTFSLTEKTVRYVVAGHPNPIWIHLKGEEKQIKPLISRSSVLGINPSFEVKVGEIEFKTGDQILAYTDGIPLNSNIRHFKQFISGANGANFEDVSENLYQEMWRQETAKSGEEPNDDVSVIWFKTAS